MKTNIALSCAAALALASFAASSAEPQSVQVCMEAFAEENFPGRAVSYQMVDEPSPMLPLIASTGTQSVEITATDGRNGRVLASGTCKVKDFGGRGYIVIGPLN